MMPGMIMLWSGSVVTIPTGWILCDGNNDTPDLRGKFVIGAGDAYDPDDTGGNTQHNHTGTAPSHSHTLQAGTAIGSGTSFTPVVSGGIVPLTIDNSDNLPPYYALCYIMRT